MFGESSAAKSQQAKKLIGKERTKIPLSIEERQIVDMHYVWNEKTKTTILVTLMDGGYISSFKISDNYYMEHHKALPQVNQTQINETLKE